MDQVKIFSFGGGVQSVAALVLAVKREIDFPVFAFANTGNDSESPETLEYLEKWVKPYLSDKNVKLLTTEKRNRAGETVTLYEHLMGNNRSISIPVYLPSGAPGTRKCTVDWKIKPIAKVTRSLGASKKTPGVIGIGISKDEVQRAKDSQISHQINEFPLLKLNLTRSDCGGIIRDAGLPVPPKSSCWFCPYKKLKEWQEMATHNPTMFEKAAELEAKLEAKRGGLGKDGVYLTRRLVPLKEAVLPCDQLKLPLYEECSGYCWT